ncbi:MAG: sigma-70 family RNA polymerase sigma factor [Gemmatimonadales bacterium]
MLVMASGEGTRIWFEHAVLAVLPDLVSTALRLTRNRADAEDLVSDAVARAWLARGSLRDRDRFRGWIFRILTNRFLSERRAHAGRAADESLDEGAANFSLFERLHQPFLLWWSTPEQEFLDKLAREDLVRAIDSLPEAFRVVVVLADVQGFSYKAIADTLAVPVGTVRSRLARGRAQLQSALWEHACDAGLNRTVHRKPDIA